MAMQSARLLIEVVAGLVPGKPDDEFTRRWVWTSEQQERLEAGDQTAREEWIRIAGESREYAASLEDPRRIPH